MSSDALSSHAAPGASQIRGLTLTETTTVLFTGLRSTRITSIAVLSLMPRLAIGAVIAHELCHAHLRMSGVHPHQLPLQTEEGVCQLWSLLWLEDKLLTSAEENTEDSGFQVLAAFLAHQIRSDPSDVYGGGVRAALASFQRVGLERLMDCVKRTGCLP
jgi:hypothetical protein